MPSSPSRRFTLPFFDRHQREYYAATASIYRGQALTLLAPALQKTIRSDCHAVYAFSSLMAVYSFAEYSIGYEGPGSTQVEANLAPFSAEWVTLLRGVATVVASSKDEIKAGPFRELLLEDELPEGLRLSRHLERRLDSLSLLLDDTAEADTDIRIAFANAIDILKLSFLRLEHIAADKCEISAALVWLWPARMGETFMALLSQRQPAALVVLAHYLVALHSIRHYWWVANGPSRMMASILAELPDSWRPWLKWPLDNIGPVISHHEAF